MIGTSEAPLGGQHERYRIDLPGMGESFACKMCVCGSGWTDLCIFASVKIERPTVF